MEFIKKYLPVYLAIREPVLYASFFLWMACSSFIQYLFMLIWLFTIIFSEHSYKRYRRYKNDYRMREKDYV